MEILEKKGSFCTIRDCLNFANIIEVNALFIFKLLWVFQGFPPIPFINLQAVFTSGIIYSIVLNELLPELFFDYFSTYFFDDCLNDGYRIRGLKIPSQTFYVFMISVRYKGHQTVVFNLLALYCYLFLVITFLCI